MSETYTLQLRSTDLVNGTKTNGTFYVDWNSFLPKYGSYRVSAYFKSFNAIDEEATQTLSIYSSLVSSNNSFSTISKGKSQLLGIAEAVNEYTVMTAGMTSYYVCRNPFTITIDYPPQNEIKIVIKDTTDSIFSSASLNNYYLVLTFESLKIN
jgi:hypothetical protein